MRVGVLVLAAGRSRRFGSDKRKALLPCGGRVIDNTLERIRMSGLPLRVCVDVSDERLAQGLEKIGFQVYRCARSAQGMGGTLAEGVSRLPDWDGVLIALADMPWITSETYRSLADILMPTTICIPVFKGQRGHPVGFGKHYWPQLELLEGDVGARSVVNRYSNSVIEQQVHNSGILKDVDEPTDL